MSDMPGTRSAAATRIDHGLRAVGLLLAWSAVASALAGALNSPAGQSRGGVALAVTFCACAVLTAWVLVPTSPQRPDSDGAREWRGASEAWSAPLSVTIARPADRHMQPAAAPRPVYDSSELAAVSSADDVPSPFLDDPLFQIEDPGPGVWLFRASKDPTQLCQDSFACDPARSVYAVTDGVSRSFMPAAWARIVAQAAVAHPTQLAGESEFAAWLEATADRWRAWMREVWRPRAAAGDWNAALDDQGAQTTMVCCCIARHVPDATGTEGEAGSVHVDVTAIGDSECLLFRPAADHWELVAAFPLEHPADFGTAPATLGTRRDPARAAATYRGLRRARFDVRSGDRLVLATDAVASWLLARAHGYSSASLPSITPSAHAVAVSHALPVGDEDLVARVLRDPETFERIAQVEIDAGRLEDDDLTLLMIAIS